MELLIVLAFLCMCAYGLLKGIAGDSSGEQPPQPSEPAPQNGDRQLVFDRMETVTVDDPRKLSDAITQKCRSCQGWFGPQLVFGEPQITSDGCTANIPVWR